MLIGDIGRAQGLKGEVRLRSFAGEPEAIATYGPLEDEDGKRYFEIERVRADGKGLVVRLKGVSTREQAEALTGTKLYVSRGVLPEAGEEEWYYSELVGLAVLGVDGAKLGTLAGVHNFGAGDLIELAPEDGGPTQLFAFNESTVPEIDVKGGWLKLVPPETIE